MKGGGFLSIVGVLMIFGLAAAAFAAALVGLGAMGGLVSVGYEWVVGP